MAAETDKKPSKDAILWQQCLIRIGDEQDEQAFSQLFDIFAPKIRAFSLAAQPGASMVADELVQDVMLKIWNKAHLYQPKKAAASTWIFTLARNARIDYLRKNGRYSSDIDPEDIYLNIVDESQDVFAATQQKQDEDNIRLSMAQLPVDQQQVLAKVYMEGKSHQQTANDLALPLGTVKSRVRLALSKLEVIMRRAL
ncbi:ECF RNA polymerase sigma factor RpoE [Sinobacterium norvegicum]|uniref:ECF RNA polymerase sigma factor RpoE n=1 Tax=Sinobacterium norvegicum TaxID=1641715 RepID=A0ABM9ADF2_9GAMM|nr:sigma-70 family RNA polymerase sigma factor [Sinobacterium norvegicum]CAH0991223.1 ECF RNA polymerase sigma factor RpoE [Sinobacterium norvegicum]